MKLLESYICEEIKKISNTKVLENESVLKKMHLGLGSFGVIEREDGNYTPEEQKLIESAYKNFIFIKEEELNNLLETKLDSEYTTIQVVTVNELGVVKIKRLDVETKEVMEEHIASVEDGNYVVDYNNFHSFRDHKESNYNRTVINTEEKIISVYQKRLIDDVLMYEKSIFDDGVSDSYILNYKKIFGENDYYEYTSLIPKEKGIEEFWFINFIKDIYAKGYPTRITNKKRNIINEHLSVENMNPDDIIKYLWGGNPGAAKVIQAIYKSDPNKFSHYMYILEKNNIVAEKIYLLYKDMCENNFNTFLKVINGLEQNKIDKDRLYNALSQPYPPEKYESFMHK